MDMLRGIMTVQERFEALEKYRIVSGPFSSSRGDLFGAFFIKHQTGKTPLKVICSPFDGESEWEHVSVSLPNRCPAWEEMCLVKKLFWGEDETVVQFHPSKSEYVNNHPYCLHLWRNTKVGYKLPPSLLVGIKGPEL
jgi:hypothetical protein